MFIQNYKNTYHKGIVDQLYKLAKNGDVIVKYATINDLYKITSSWYVLVEVSEKDEHLDEILTCVDLFLKEKITIDDIQLKIDTYEHRFHPRTKKTIKERIVQILN